MGRVADKYIKATGKKGEDEACRFLEEMGHKILKRNWRSGSLEIDIISRDSRGIHFVEVKTRRPPLQGNPEDSVNRGKQRRIARAANRFFYSPDREISCWEEESFFDVVTVVFDGKKTNIQYFEEAFIPIYV